MAWCFLSIFLPVLSGSPRWKYKHTPSRLNHPQVPPLCPRQELPLPLLSPASVQLSMYFAYSLSSSLLVRGLPRSFVSRRSLLRLSSSRR